MFFFLIWAAAMSMISMVNNTLPINKLISLILSALTIPIATHMLKKNMLPNVIFATSLILFILAFLYITFFTYNELSSFYILKDVYLHAGFLCGLLVLLCININRFNYLIPPLVLSLIIFGARGPQLSFFIIITFFAISKLKYGFNSFKKKKIFYFVSAIALVIIILFNAEGFYERALGRWSLIFKGDDGSSLRRIELIEMSLYSIIDKPLLGVGFGSFGTLFQNMSINSKPHNFIFELLSETGLIGSFPIFMFLTLITIKSIIENTWSIFLYVLFIMLFSYSYTDLNEFYFAIAYVLSFKSYKYENNRDNPLPSI